MINVLHISPTGMDIGGTEESIYLLCKHFNPDKVSNYLWSPYGGGSTLDALIDQGILTAFTSTLDADELVSFIKINCIKIAIVHSGALNQLHALLPIRVIQELQGIRIIEVMCRPIPSWGSPFGVDNIVAPSRYVAQKQRLEDQSITRVIPNGIDLNQYRFSLDERRIYRRVLGIPDTAKVVGFIGRLEEEKGPQDLLEAASLIAKNIDNVYFLFGGDGPLLQDLKVQAANAGLSNIHFLGRVKKNERRSFYSALDLAVFPTRDEAYGLVVAEAMAARLSVIAYRVGALPDLVPECEDLAVLVKPHDIDILSSTVTNILVDDNKRARIAHDNYRFIEQHSIQRTARCYEDLMQDILSANSLPCRLSEPTAGMLRYIGYMFLTLGDTSRAESCFYRAVKLQPELYSAINIDIQNINKHILQLRRNQQSL